MASYAFSKKPEATAHAAKLNKTVSKKVSLDRQTS